MEKKEITLKSTEEIENIAAGNVAIDAAIISRRKSIDYIIKVLTDEKKAIDAAILESVNHKKVKTALFSTIISDFMEFSKEDFIADHGEDTYNKYKTKPVHREQVRT